MKNGVTPGKSRERMRSSSRERLAGIGAQGKLALVPLRWSAERNRQHRRRQNLKSALLKKRKKADREEAQKKWITNGVNSPDPGEDEKT